MDGHASPVGQDGPAGESRSDTIQDSSLALALLIRRALQEFVGGSEPPGEVWERILAQLRGSNLATHSASSGPSGSLP